MTPPPLSTGRRAARTPAARALVFALALVAACGDSSGLDTPDPGITIVSGGSGTDTILALPAERLVVEVRDAEGRLAPGTTVVFSIPPASGTTDVLRHMYVCGAAMVHCASFGSSTSTTTDRAEVVTDDAGRASVRVQHGVVAGPGRVAIAAPALGYTATAAFTTRPGATARIAAAWLDTAVYVGASFAPDARAVDRFGNATSEPVTLESRTPSVATVSGERVTAVAIGRARVAMRTPTFVDTLFVSVPPAGRLVVSRWAGANQLELALLSMDGTGSRRLALQERTEGWAFPTWSWDGRRVMFINSFPAGWTFAVDTATGARTAVVDTAAFQSVSQVSYTRGGAAIFFYGIVADNQGIYRANGDGTGAQLVRSSAFYPWVSPDGGRLVFVDFTNTTKVRDLTTGAEWTLPDAREPLWSPTGDLLAVTTHGPGGRALFVVAPDGTGRRLLAENLYSVGSWSSDGQWIAVVAGDFATAHVELIRVADGERLPIPGTRWVYQVGWRP